MRLLLLAGAIPIPTARGASDNGGGGEGLAAFCGCSSQGSAGWGAFAASPAYECWVSHQKLPSGLFEHATQIYYGLGEESAAEFRFCPVGLLNIVTIIGLVWEAHDVEQSVFAELLNPGIELFEQFREDLLSHVVSSWGVLRCQDFLPGSEWIFNVAKFQDLSWRTQRKFGMWNHLLSQGEEPRQPREEHRYMTDRSLTSGQTPEVGIPPTSICMCLLFLEGARTVVHAMDTYNATGLFSVVDERFIVFLEDAAESSDASRWRSLFLARWGFEVLDADSEHRWPAAFIRIGGRVAYRRVGKAMAACALRSRSDLILFLEEDWEVITRPRALVRLRVDDAARLLREGDADMVHLRHKLFYGKPFYELLTAVQHNEPPPFSAALYFSEDPVREGYPESHWRTPFLDSGGFCDSNRSSWFGALRFQWDRAAAPAPRPPRWCSDSSASVCVSTLAVDDPFRNVFYTTNPMLFRREHWLQHFGPQAAVLGDARAVEEVITVSHMWRSHPGFRVGFSPGIFRHRRLDRAAHAGAAEPPERRP